VSLLATIGITPLFGFHHTPTAGLEEVKYRHFVMALEHFSTFNYFTVVTVKDLRSNKAKEVCTKGNFSIRLGDKEMKAFAHILFNMGLLTGESSCWGR